jgi:hypothetical protein
MIYLCAAVKNVEVKGGAKATDTLGTISVQSPPEHQSSDRPNIYIREASHGAEKVGLGANETSVQND